MKHIISTFLLLFSFSFSYAQCMKGNCENGKGTFRLGGGMTYVGDFVDGQAEGLGILFYDNGDRYSGEWSKNKRHGRGKFQYSGGSQYLGSFDQNEIKGEGKMIYASGDVYEGNFAQSLPHGNGTMTFVNGAEYSGHFKYGRFEGFGVMVYEDRSMYEGNWTDGKWNGTGEFTDQNGVAFAAEWKAGHPVKNESDSNENDELASSIEDANYTDPVSQDLVVEEFLFNDGSVYHGELKNGVPFGRGEVTYASGNKYKGYWRDNAPHGEGTMYYTSGRIVTAIWNKGQPVRDLNSLNQLSLDKIIVPDVDENVKVWALVIGAGRYDHMPGLKYADDDAYQFYAFLKSPEGGALPDEQIRLVIDESATIPNILAQMQSLFYKADSNDVVMMFYSGHGLDGSFVPIDYNGHSDLLGHSQLKTVFNKSKARHKICIADACYSGSFAVAKKINEAALQEYYSAFQKATPGTAFLLSSKDKEVSLEDKGLKQGVFSHFLIRGMKGEADADNNGITNIGELYEFLYEAVKRYTGGAQTPILSGSFDKNMPIGIKRSYLDY